MLIEKNIDNKTQENPFFSSSFKTPFEAYPFDRIQTAHFAPAFEVAIEQKRHDLRAIEENQDAPTFENTIVALEESGKMIELVSGAFFNLLHTNSTDELMVISEEFIPKLTELSSEEIFSEAIFNRVKAVYDQRQSLALDEEDLRLLQNTYEGFVDSGALLSAEDKVRLKQLRMDLSRLTLQFQQNELKDEHRFCLHLVDPQDLKGFPENILELAKLKAKERGYAQGWAFDLTAPSMGPFMQFCQRRDLREQMYRERRSVAAKGDEYDNKEIVRSIVNIRLEIAKILGFNTFAECALHRRMAKNPETVYKLLDQLLEAYHSKSLDEIRMITDFAYAQGAEGELQAWDWAFWTKRYMVEHFEIDEEELRPYLPLENVTKGVFGLATTLYGIRFVENTQIPVYHEGVKVYEVRDEENKYLGLLYTDFFPRKEKQSGAWMNNFRDLDGTIRPHVVIVMNFTPPTDNKPSLLTMGEVNTFLHEFGHALHGLLTQTKYTSLSGTNVTRDFVELPSQLMENFLRYRKFTDTFAAHYKTGEKIPEDLIQKRKKVRNFLAAYATMRQLSFGYLDMGWHSITKSLSTDVSIKDFEMNAWKKALILPEVEDDNQLMSTSFGHIFSGGYAAGYYGYKWAEVLDADAFSVFKKNGIFDRKTAASFRKNILEMGDVRDADVLYRQFRGANPSIEALLQRDGILPEEEDDDEGNQ